MKNHPRNFLLSLALCSFVFSACGGGTAGTSSTGDGQFNKLFEGSVNLVAGSPIEGASVQLKETGEKVITDLAGRFHLGTELTGSTATFIVRKESKATEVQINNLSSESSVVGLQVSLGETQQRSNFELAVLSVDGNGCSGVFSEAQVIRFASSTPPILVIKQLVATDNATCSVHLRIAENGVPHQGIGFQLLFVSFDSSGITQIQEKSKGETDEAGNGILSFPLTTGKNSDGYYLIETPLSLPVGERVGVVVSLLAEVQ